jgi:nucleotide-binding universal stress UspA family protein
MTVGARAGARREAHLSGKLSMYKHILIPSDGSEISAAAALAGIAFAKDAGADVVLFHAAPPYQYPVYADAVPFAYPTPSEHRASARAYGERLLDALGKVALAAGVGSSADLQFGPAPAKAIVNAARKHGCDLIFIGSHGRGGVGSLLLGSVTTKVLATCRTPLLVHRAGKRELAAAASLLAGTRPASGKAAPKTGAAARR